MPSRRPNFLCFVTDQQRADHLGCAGNAVLRTPNLDRLAAEGLRFTRAYVNNPLCMPSRATMFTGRTARGHGVRTNGIPLEPCLPTLTGALAAAGYRTHSVGKIHLRPFQTPRGVPVEALEPEEHPESYVMWNSERLQTTPTPYYGLQTVDLAIGHGPGVTGDYGRWLLEQNPDGPRLMQPAAGEAPASGAEQSWKMALPEELHVSRWVADRTIAFLEAAAREDRPFFAWCSFPDPHHPYCPPAPWCDLYDPASIPLPRRREGELDALPPHYAKVFREALPLSGRFAPTDLRDDQLRDILALTYGLISLADHHLGRVLEALDRLGLRESTVVTFLSDHGDMMGDHWIINKGPFHFDGLVNVPFIWSWPGQFGAGTTTEALASMLDFAPTVLDLAGVPIPEGETPAEREADSECAPWPGVSLRPVLEGEAESVQESVVIENDEDYLGLRLRTLVTRRYKLTAYPGQPYGELFDLANDPDELHNLWDEPSCRDTKRDLLVQLMERVVLTDSALPRRLSHA